MKVALHLPLFEANYVLLKVLPTGMILIHELFWYVYIAPPDICHIARKIVSKGSISLHAQALLILRNNVTIRQT